jgi:hypothetical protein
MRADIEINDESNDAAVPDTTRSSGGSDTPPAAEEDTPSNAIPESPVIEVVSEGMDEGTDEQVVEIDGEDDETADAVFEALPYLERFQSKEGVMEAIYNHVQDGRMPHRFFQSSADLA